MSARLSLNWILLPSTSVNILNLRKPCKVVFSSWRKLKVSAFFPENWQCFSPTTTVISLAPTKYRTGSFHGEREQIEATFEDCKMQMQSFDHFNTGQWFSDNYQWLKLYRDERPDYLFKLLYCSWDSWVVEHKSYIRKSCKNISAEHSEICLHIL